MIKQNLKKENDFMNIIDIAKEIEAKGKKTDAVSIVKTEWKPTECKEYTLPEFTISKSRNKANTKKQLSKVLAFIDTIKYIRLSYGCTIMPIATTNKKLIRICGSQRNASNLIGFMITLGLLDEYDASYQYNATVEKHNKSKTYRYYYENEQKIISYCKENDISKYTIRNNKLHTHTVVERLRVENFEKQQVRFSSDLYLLKPDNYSVAGFENHIEGVLYENYPYLSHYQELADNINDKYYAEYPEMAISFVPHFTWDKRKKAIIKIGIRATNTLVSAKKNKNDYNENFYGFYKDDILEKYGLNLEKDVKSSVPRITLSMNKKRWVPEETDIYKDMYDRYTMHNNTVTESFDEVRAAIKKLHMRGYFDKENLIGVHTRRVMANVVDKNEVDKEMKIYQNAIIDAEGGKLYGNEIFLHESCIYMDVLNTLLEDGYFVWQCYDAWYAKKEGVTQEQFQQYTTNLVAEKANLYIHNIDTVVERLKVA